MQEFSISKRNVPTSLTWKHIYCCCLERYIMRNKIMKPYHETPYHAMKIKNVFTLIITICFLPYCIFFIVIWSLKHVPGLLWFCFVLVKSLFSMNSFDLFLDHLPERYRLDVKDKVIKQVPPPLSACLPTPHDILIGMETLSALPPLCERTRQLWMFLLSLFF